MAELKKTTNSGLIFFWKTVMLISACKEVYMLPNAVSNNASVTDLSPCEDGWEHDGEYCIKAMYGRVEWREASAKCSSLGGYLASIHSKKQNAFMIDLFEKIGEEYWWIGLHDQDLDGVFEWVDGTDVDYTNWRPDEPYGDYQSGNCVATSVNFIYGKWLVFPCEREFHYPCHKKAVTYATTTTALGDRTAASVMASAEISHRAIVTARETVEFIETHAINGNHSTNFIWTFLLIYTYIKAESVIASAEISDRSSFLSVTPSLLTLLLYSLWLWI